MEEFSVTRKIQGCTALFVAFTFLLAISLFGLVFYIWRNNTDMAVNWLLFSLLFLVGTVIFFKMAFFPKKLLVVNEKGFIDQWSYAEVGFVPWEDVESVKWADPRGDIFILVFLHQPDQFIENLPPVSKFRAGRLRSIQMPPVVIHVGKTGNWEEIFGVMRGFFEYYCSKTKKGSTV